MPYFLIQVTRLNLHTVPMRCALELDKLIVGAIGSEQRTGVFEILQLREQC